jgi:hypothetical protein
MQMTSTPDALVHLVEQAFADVPDPGDDARLIEPGADGHYRETLASTWRGLKWRNIDAAWLAREGEDALIFMTPASVHYFMPAFLVAAVVAYEAMDVAVDTLVSVLAPRPASDERRHRFDAIQVTFTVAQAHAIAEVLRWLHDTRAADFLPDETGVSLLDRAIEYWSTRPR